MDIREEDLFLIAEEEVKLFEPQLRDLIAINYNKPFTLEYRIKSLEKLQRKQILWQQNKGFLPSISQLPDIIAYRISVDDEEDCKIISSIISQFLRPQRLKDYFHIPKETGFKAFLYFFDNRRINTEIQIMSTKMRDWTNATHEEHDSLKYGDLDMGRNRIANYENVTTVEELLIFLSENIKYGIKDNNSVVHRVNWNDNESLVKWRDACRYKWRFQTAKEIIERGYGHCYDQVEIAREWLVNQGYEVRTFWTNDGRDNHAFIIFYDVNENKWVFFEHSDAKARGIYKFESLEEALVFQRDNALKNWRSTEDIEELKKQYTIIEFDNIPYDISRDEYGKFIFQEGKRISLDEKKVAK